MRTPPKKIEVDGESVYLKKDWTGYYVVEPFKREDGTTNWFAGWKKALMPMLFLLILTSLFMLAYFYEVNQIRMEYGQIASHPLQFCKQLLGEPFKLK